MVGQGFQLQVSSEEAEHCSPRQPSKVSVGEDKGFPKPDRKPHDLLKTCHVDVADN